MSNLPRAERERTEQQPLKWTPIVDSTEAVAARLGAAQDQAWRAIKSKCAAGLLTLEGIDEKGRPRTIERHWVIYIVPWGRQTPSGEHIETDIPDRDSGSMIAFDRQRAHRDRLADERDGVKPRSLPPMRLREVVADAAQLDQLWSRAEYDFKSPDWSLGNVLSWITFNDPVLICEFEGRRDLLAYRQYNHRRSGFVYPEARISRADQVLLDALQTGRVTAIRNGTSVPSTHWFGKNAYQLTDDLRFRREEVRAIDWSHESQREQPDHYAGGGKLVPLNAAIERYPENRETIMRIIESAWQIGEITLWGRRKGHAMPEPIRQYHGLVIDWHAGTPKGDYYTEAYAHPAEPSADYHRHEWEDLAIPRADLEKLYNSRETDRAFLRDNITRAADTVLANESTEAALTAEKARPLGLVSDTPALETPPTASGMRDRLRYKPALAEWMARKGFQLLRRMAPEDIAAGFKAHCEVERRDLLPLPSRLRSMEGTIVKILNGMEKAAEGTVAKDHKQKGR